MIPSVTATLTGLSLTGASFLVTLTRNIGEDSDAVHVRLARKFFIKAFFMFLICTIVLFVFDFLEILDERHAISYTILDVIISYVLFGIGAVYMAIQFEMEVMLVGLAIISTGALFYVIFNRKSSRDK